MPLELRHLLLSEVAFVARVTLERERVVGILRVSLMVDVVLAILPVRELNLIVAHLGCRSIIFRQRFVLTLWRLYLEWPE